MPVRLLAAGGRKDDAVWAVEAELAAAAFDEPGDQRWRGSSSLAKKIEADFRMSLASRSSAFSFFDRLISASSSLLGPGPGPGVDLGLQHPLT